MTSASPRRSHHPGPYWVAGGCVVILGLASFTGSFRGLRDWGRIAGFPGALAYLLPLMIDLFIVVGEARVLIGVLRGWSPKRQLPGWGIAVAGLAASTAGNVGASWLTAGLPTRITAAVPPLAFFAASAVGLGILKLVILDAETPAAGEATAPQPAALMPSANPSPPRVPARTSDARQRREDARAYVAGLNGGPLPSARALAEQFRIDRKPAGEILKAHQDGRPLNGAAV